ncbi:YibE/F family protein [Clostridium cellulovorans]|uniref:YibE/F family protein n=1 Tax=Clostridium cellulovorans (strain ATCC 35296 / DSM 3052 / OCM 3 / 743B) TaxID=573061 RepID=D9SMW6_CLOC7|nr:YibE/F family protein [Clostridium cellulovorans]ADL51832.1 YibE/F family protein [Clostridium cellulovorans 743B]
MIKNKKFQMILSVILLLIFFIILYFFNVKDHYTYKNNSNLEYVKAKVLSVTEETLTEDTTISNLYIGQQKISVELLEGTGKGGIFEVTNNLSRLYNVKVKPGMKVIVSVDKTGTQTSPVSIYSYYRAPVSIALVFIFFALLTLIGGRKGVKAILGLCFTLICIIFLFLPMIIKGYSPILSAILVVILTTFMTFVLSNGYTIKTLSAILGTIFGVTFAGIIAYLAGNLANLSTLNTDEIETLILISSDTSMNVKGILFAGIIIASLGAVMDIGISISSAINELHTINPKLTHKSLFMSGMNIGKDIIGTMSNTLILAFTGGSINLLILLYSFGMPSSQLFNLDVLSIEIVQGLAGCIGVILTVPITAILTTFLMDKAK